MANLLAPRVCTSCFEPAGCGEVVRVLRERWEPDFGVHVGLLECDAGHSWVDQRNDDTARLHPWRGQARLPFSERSRTVHKHELDT